MKRVLITGGCGFIGTNLVQKLLQVPEVQIAIFDNLIVGKPENLGEVSSYRQVSVNQREVAWKEAPVVLNVGDIRDEKAMLEACRGIDAVVHLAANTGVIPSIENPFLDCDINVRGLLNCLEGSRQAGVRRFVLASSGAPLGEKTPPIHEDMAPSPQSPYGASKLAGEGYCSAYFGSFGLETVALRFGNVYGPGSLHKGSVVAKFISHILNKEPLPVFGDGSQTRDFIYVEELVRAVECALFKEGDLGGEIFQVATNQEHTVQEIAEVLIEIGQKYLGQKASVEHRKARKGEVHRNFSDTRKARNILGFHAVMDLREGLEKTFLSAWKSRNE